ncbi:MAG: Radical SAM superfamily protein [bacterium ADurb.Bin243]|nr:MAG: Radical SAM superfamily protein [bacterium ADurb.Bin243]
MLEKNFKILLLDAPQSVWKWFDGTLPSPALAILASYTKTLYDVRVLDLNVDKTPWQSLKNCLSDFAPDLIAIPCTHTCHVNEVRAALLMIRKFSPKTLVCGGGVHFKVFHKDYLEEGLVDFIATGEGELTFSELTRSLCSFKNRAAAGNAVDISKKYAELKAIDGLAFICDGVVHVTKTRAHIHNLDKIPFPSYEMFPMRHYKIPIYGGNETFGITFGRGCANRCCFCSESFGWDYTLRRNSPEYAVRHIELLRDNYARTTFIFADTDFLLNREWVEEFIDIIKQKKVKIKFHIQTACTTIIRNESLVPKLKEIGLFEIMLGTESPFQNVLNKLKSFHLNQKTMIEAMQIVKKYDVLLMAMMFWGTEYDSAETLREGLKFFDKYADITCPNVLTPYPGTPLYEEMKEKGKIYVEDMAVYDQSHVIAPAGGMSYAQTRFTYEMGLLRHYNLNPFYYMGLFSKNRFLRINYWHFTKLIWMNALEGFMNPVRYHKKLYDQPGYESVMGEAWKDGGR